MTAHDCPHGNASQEECPTCTRTETARVQENEALVVAYDQARALVRHWEDDFSFGATSVDLREENRKELVRRIVAMVWPTAPEQRRPTALPASWATEADENLPGVAREFCADWGIESREVIDDLTKLLEETRTIDRQRRESVPPVVSDGAVARDVQQAIVRQHELRIAAWLRRYADEHSGSHPANAGHITCNAAASEIESGAWRSAPCAGSAKDRFGGENPPENLARFIPTVETKLTDDEIAHGKMVAKRLEEAASPTGYDKFVAEQMQAPSFRKEYAEARAEVAAADSSSEPLDDLERAWRWMLRQGANGGTTQQDVVDLMNEIRAEEREACAAIVDHQASVRRMRAQVFEDDSDRADGEAQADDVEREETIANALEFVAARVRHRSAKARNGGDGG